MHIRKHDVGAQSRAGDEGAAGADQHRRRRVEGAHHRRNVRGQQLHHARIAGLHNIGNDQQAAHRYHDGHDVLDGLLADVPILAELHADGRSTQQTADQNHHVHPDNVAEGAHDGEAVGHQRREAVAHRRQQDQHIHIRRKRLKRAVLPRAPVKVIAVLLRGLDLHQLDISHREQDSDQACAHGRNLSTHKVGKHEHHAAGGHAREKEIRHNALEALPAERHKDHNKGNDQHAEHVDAAHHGGVQRHGTHARLHQRRTAVDGGQTRAAPRAGRSVSQQRHGNRGNRVEAQRHQEGRRNGRRGARARRAFQKDRQHQADDDHLHPAVVADAGDGGLHVLNGPRFPQNVQNHERAEDHHHDLEAFLQSLPNQRIECGDILREGRARHVEIRKAEK